MNQIILQLKDEWQTNHRLRIMVNVIAITLMFYILLVITEIQQDRSEQLNQNIINLNKIKKIQEEPIWVEREKLAVKQKEAFENQLWRASSKGLAQAKFQAFLRATLKNKITANTITLENIEQLNDDGSLISLWRAGAQIRGAYKYDELQQFIYTINQHSKKTTIRSLNFSVSPNTSRVSNFNLFVDAWFDAAKTGDKP